MTEKELGAQEPCGCGSGLPYIQCCKSDIAQFVRNRRGQIRRQVGLSSEAVEVLKKAEGDFKLVFGRKPRRDRIFIESYRYSEEDFRRDFELSAERAGTPKPLVYAYRKTGLMLTEQTFEVAPPADRDEWLGAIREYEQAEAAGVDLLFPEWDSVLVALQVCRTQIDHAVIHLGSYADRAPRGAGRNLALFLQFLMISRCHRQLKGFADGLVRGMGDEAFALLRSIYECSLLMARLEMEPSYADAVIAQALVGTDLYQYRIKQDGRHDYSKILSSDGKTFPGRTSWQACAVSLGEHHARFFELLYPTLCAHVHFDTVSLIGRYQDSGSFLAFEEPDDPAYTAMALIVLIYVSALVANLKSAPKVIRRDAGFLRTRLLKAFDYLHEGLKEEDTAIAPTFAELYEALTFIPIGLK